MAYNKINWENGEISKEGYVLIDGQEYQTVQPEYTGNTPINASNLDHMDEGIKEAHDASVVRYITKSGENLNDYVEQGIYFFNGSYTPVNIPIGINGWLQVLSMGEKDTNDFFIKQLWYRAGTPDINDLDIYVRTRSWDGRWGSWKKIPEDRQILYNGGDATTATLLKNVNLFKRIKIGVISSDGHTSVVEILNPSNSSSLTTSVMLGSTVSDIYYGKAARIVINGTNLTVDRISEIGIRNNNTSIVSASATAIKVYYVLGYYE